MERSAARALSALRVTLEDAMPEELLEHEVFLIPYRIVLDDPDEFDEVDHDQELNEGTSDAIIGLECLQERLLRDLKSGIEYDHSANVMLKEAIKQAYGSFGIESWCTPSLEAIDVGVSTNYALNVSLEGLNDTLKQLWAALKEQLTALAIKFDRIFDRLIRGAEALHKQGEALTHSSRQFTQGTVSGSTMKVVGASIIHYRGKVDGGSVLQGLGNLNDAYRSAYDSTTDISGNYYKQVGEMASHLLHVKTEDEINYRMFETFYEISSQFNYHSEEFSGGYVFEPVPIETRYAKEMGYQITRNGGANLTFETSIATPTPKEIERIGTEIIRVANGLMWGRIRLRKIQRDQDTCVREVDKLISQSDKDFRERMTTRALSTKVARLANKTLAAPMNRLNIIAFQAARAALVYGESALRVMRTSQVHQ